MQLGKTIVGALIGAALGIGLLVAVYLLFGIDHVWLAVPVAILTGIGVRMLVSTWGHASYARGALTGLLALAAYVAGWFLVAEVAKARAASAPDRVTPAAASQDDDEVANDEADSKGDVGVEAPNADTPDVRQAPASGMTARPVVAPKQFSPIDFVWLSIAALIAYELGRGTGAKSTDTETVQEDEPASETEVRDAT